MTEQRPVAGTDRFGSESQSGWRGRGKLASWVSRSPAVRLCVKENSARSREKGRATRRQRRWFSVEKKAISIAARTATQLDQRRAKNVERDGTQRQC